MHFKILNDEDVLKLPIKKAISSIEELIKSNTQNPSLISPPRHYVSNNVGSLVFTVGGHYDNGPFGFRVYQTISKQFDEQQFVCIYNGSSGQLKGIICGQALGALRTGAIGGIAIKYCSKEDANIVGVLGSGLQAMMQLEACCAVRDIRLIKVFSPNEQNKKSFVRKAKEKLNIEVIFTSNAREVVVDSDILLVATSSSRPVFESGWLNEGVHINSVGHKFVNDHELPMDITNPCKTFVTDSLAQIQSYPKKHFLSETNVWPEIIALSNVVNGHNAKCLKQSSSVFLSVGLAGTEILVGDLLFE